jgi:hypothetical protein
MMSGDGKVLTLGNMAVHGVDDDCDFRTGHGEMMKRA